MAADTAKVFFSPEPEYFLFLQITLQIRNVSRL